MTERVEYKGAVLFPLLVEEFRVIAQSLRVDNPGGIIRNAEVFAACTEEFSERSWILRIDSDSDVPSWLHPHLRTRLRRIGFPIWIPSNTRPNDIWWMRRHLPKVKDGRIVWPRRRSRSRPQVHV